MLSLILLFFLTASYAIAQETVEQGQISPEQLEQARQAVERGEITPAEVEKLKEAKGLGTLTPEEIEAGKKLLEEQQRNTYGDVSPESEGASEDAE